MRTMRISVIGMRTAVRQTIRPIRMPGQYSKTRAASLPVSTFHMSLSPDTDQPKPASSAINTNSR